jgi:hypothetical protein
LCAERRYVDKDCTCAYSSKKKHFLFLQKQSEDKRPDQKSGQGGQKPSSRCGTTQDKRQKVAVVEAVIGGDLSCSTRTIKREQLYLQLICVDQKDFGASPHGAKLKWAYRLSFNRPKKEVRESWNKKLSMSQSEGKEAGTALEEAPRSSIKKGG